MQEDNGRTEWQSCFSPIMQRMKKLEAEIHACVYMHTVPYHVFVFLSFYLLHFFLKVKKFIHVVLLFALKLGLVARTEVYK